MKNEILTFGKYKGQPVEILLSDKKYLDWLMSQEFFRSKYENFYNIIINNNNEISDTPEHNAMQIKFLNEIYRRKFIYKILYPALKNKFIIDNDLSMIRINTDMSIYYKYQNVKKINRFNIKTSFEPIDVYISIEHLIGIKNEDTNAWEKYNYYKLGIEIKPVIGDDYPSILRKIKRNNINSYTPNINIVLVGEYTGIGASKEQFVSFFENEKIKVIFENEIEETNTDDSFFEIVFDQQIINDINKNIKYFENLKF